MMLTYVDKIALLVPILLYVTYVTITRFSYRTTPSIETAQRTSEANSPRYDMDNTSTQTGVHSTASEDQRAKYISDAHYPFNCENIGRIKISGRLGNGISKLGLLGSYQGQMVVLKMSVRQGYEVRRCIASFNDSQMNNRCHNYPGMKIMKEIMFMHEVSDQYIAPLLGYCLHGNVTLENGRSVRGLVSVFKYGKQLTREHLSAVHWKIKLKYANDIAKILHYLENSPLGNLRYPDFKITHFVIIKSTLMLIDLDMASNREKGCNDVAPCPYDLLCNRTTSTCDGYNKKFNLRKFRVVFGNLALKPDLYPAYIAPKIERLNSSLTAFSIDVLELINTLQSIQGF